MSLEIKVKLTNCRSKLQITELANQIHANQELLAVYYKLSAENAFEDADKAAWVIRSFFQQEKGIDLKHQKKIIQLLTKVENEAVLRNLSGVMADFPFDKKLSEEVINLSFRILSEDHHDVAVYANFMIALIPSTTRVMALAKSPNASMAILRLLPKILKAVETTPDRIGATNLASHSIIGLAVS